MKRIYYQKLNIIGILPMLLILILFLNIKFFVPYMDNSSIFTFLIIKSSFIIFIYFWFYINGYLGIKDGYIFKSYIPFSKKIRLKDITEIKRQEEKLMLKTAKEKLIINGVFISKESKIELLNIFASLDFEDYDDLIV